MSRFIPPLGYQKRAPKDLKLHGSFTDRRWYALGLVLFVLGIFLHQSLLIVCGLLIVFILGTTGIWARYCLRDVSYQRHFSEQRVLFGEKITLALAVENAKLLPLPWLEIEDTIPRDLSILEQHVRKDNLRETAILECLFSPSWYERITRKYTVRCMTRGIHTFGPTRIRSGDAFGFINQEMELSNRQFVLVYPLIVPLQRFNLPSRHPFGDIRARQRLLEDPLRVLGVRDYAYGDSMRRVNWKATARAMKMQSKIYDSTTTHTVAIFLNAAARADTYYGIYPELGELAICAAASVADWALNQGYAAGLYANTSMYMPDDEITVTPELARGEQLGQTLAALEKKRRIRLPAASGEEQRKRIMEALARIHVFFSGDIEETVRGERAHLPSGATVVVITGNVSEVLIDTLFTLQQRGYSPSILFVGNAPLTIKLGSIPMYYIGGEDTWLTFQSAAADAEDVPVAQKTPGFSL